MWRESPTIHKILEFEPTYSQVAVWIIRQAAQVSLRITSFSGRFARRILVRTAIVGTNLIAVSALLFFNPAALFVLSVGADVLSRTRPDIATWDPPFFLQFYTGYLFGVVLDQLSLPRVLGSASAFASALAGHCLAGILSESRP